MGKEKQKFEKLIKKKEEKTQKIQKPTEKVETKPSAQVQPTVTTQPKPEVIPQPKRQRPEIRQRHRPSFATQPVKTERKFFSLFPYGKLVPFSKFRFVAFLISALAIAFSIFGLASGKLPLGTDFRGGVLATVRFENPPEISLIRKAIPEATVQDIGNGEFVIKLPVELVEKLKAEGKDAGTYVREKLGTLGTKFEVLQLETVSAVIGKELVQKGIFAAVLSLLGIFLYCMIRFEWKFALGAVIALVHDLLITLLFMMAVKVELSLVTLAGLLAIAGYSVNDSVIIADRIREKLRLARTIFKEEILDRAVSDTLPRTVLTSLTTLFPTCALIFFGGQVLRDLGLVFLAGILVGTYSSIFIVGGTALELSKRFAK